MRAILFLLLAASATAQVNTERMRRAVADEGATLSLDASAAYATGNTEYLRLGLGGRVDGRVGDGAAFAVARTDLSRADGRAYLDRSFAHARYSHIVVPRLSLETFAQIERNRQQRLISRTLLGLGARYEVFDQDSLGLAVGVTPMIEHEELDEQLGETPTAVVRASTYASARWIVNATTSLGATTYVQPRVDDVGDVRVLTQATLGVGLTRALRLQVQVNLRVDSRPPDGVEAADFSIQNGLVLVLPVRS